MPIIEKLLGLVNTVDPVRAELGSLATAVNVDIDDTASAVMRPGQTAFGSFGTITAAYATRDMQRLYVVDDGDLKLVNPDGTSLTIESGVGSGEVWWAENAGNVFYSGASQGLILANTERVAWGIPTPSSPAVTVMPGSMPAGRYFINAVYTDETGRMGGSDVATVVEATESCAIRAEVPAVAGHTAEFYMSSLDGDTPYYVGESEDGVLTIDVDLDLLSQALPIEHIGAFPPPSGQQIALFQGRTYVAQVHPTADVTHIFFSRPFYFHLFDYASDYIAVPGEVRMLAPIGNVLAIGTDRQVLAYDGESIVTMADYGMPEGQGWSELEDQNIVFWTDRGLCRALPFENITEQRFSAAPGSRAVVQFMQHNGYNKALIVARDNEGDAFNDYLSG